MRLTRLALLLALIAGACAFSMGGVRAQDTGTPPPQAVETNPPIPSPRPTAEDPKIRKLAVQQFLAWQSGTVDRDLYSDQVNAQLTDDMMDKGTKTLANLGALQHAAFNGVSQTKGVTFYVYQMACANGTIVMEFTLDPDGRIGLIFFE